MEKKRDTSKNKKKEILVGGDFIFSIRHVTMMTTNFMDGHIFLICRTENCEYTSQIRWGIESEVIYLHIEIETS